MMAYKPGDKLEWHEYYEVGNDTINEQHQKLFALLNDLIDACNEGKASREMLGGALHFLAKYVFEHFNYEEHIMEEYELPKREFHEHLHHEFSKTVRELVNSYDNTGEASDDELHEALKKTVNIVAAWFVTHILDHDIRTYENLQ